MKRKDKKPQNFPKQLFLYYNDATAFYNFLADLPAETQYKVLTKLGELRYSYKESLHEPHFKFFTDRRYKGLIELRIKSKVLIRVIFMQRGDEYIILDFFIKQCPRDTISALEKADRVRRRLIRTPKALVELVPSEASYELKS